MSWPPPHGAPLPARSRDPEALARIARAALQGPRAGQADGISVVVVTDPEQRAALARLAHEEDWAARGRAPWLSPAPAHLVLCVEPAAYRGPLRRGRQGPCRPGGALVVGGRRGGPHPGAAGRGGRGPGRRLPGGPRPARPGRGPGPARGGRAAGGDHRRPPPSGRGPRPAPPRRRARPHCSTTAPGDGPSRRPADPEPPPGPRASTPRRLSSPPTKDHCHRRAPPHLHLRIGLHGPPRQGGRPHRRCRARPRGGRRPPGPGGLRGAGERPPGDPGRRGHRLSHAGPRRPAPPGAPHHRRRRLRLLGERLRPRARPHPPLPAPPVARHRPRRGRRRRTGRRRPGDDDRLRHPPDPRVDAPAPGAVAPPGGPPGAGPAARA